MSDNRPIGLLDSGVGGLTVARAIMDMLPNERLVYIGDTARSPYGPQPQGDIRAYTSQIVAHLVQQGVKLVVVACNTATAAALFDNPITASVPILGVISPAVEHACHLTKTGRVGVIGTEGTISSQAYDRALARYVGSDAAGEGERDAVTLVSQACPDFVTFAEQGRTTDVQVMAYARAILAPIQAANVDTLILGCTHYPLLTGVIGHVMGPDVALVSSAETSARRVFTYLVTHDMLADDEPQTQPEHIFASTGDEDEFARLAQRFLGPRIATDTVQTVTLA